MNDILKSIHRASGEIIKKYECDKCKDTMFVETNDNFVKPCECRDNKILKNKLTFANIPLAFKDNELSNFSIKIYKREENQKRVFQVLRVINIWLDKLQENEEKGKGIYIYSETKGSGKTRLVSSLGNELIRKYHKQVRFITSMSIIAEIRNSWNSESGYSEQKLIQEFKNAQVLIIDDLGAEQIKDWVNDRFYDIINTRYINKKITIFTSNFSIDNLPYDDRITNRIKEMCYEMQFANESVRNTIAKEDQDELVSILKQLK